MVEVRVIGPDDWAVWRELRLTALEEAPYAFGSRLADWQGEHDREQRWRNRLSTPGARSVVAVLDGRPVGMAAGVPGDEDGVVELVSMWVSPDARGRGVGDVLIHAIESWARSVSARTLRLAVADGNERASALYERHGFRRSDEPPRTTRGGARCEFVMAKSVQSTG